MIEIYHHPTKEIVNLLVQAVIGTPGKSITYRLSEVSDKIDFIPNPAFLALKKKSTIVATCCLCHRSSVIELKKIHISYIRYFAFLPAYQKGSNNIKNKKLEKTGLLKKEIQSLLEKPSENFFLSKEPHLFYAFVDQENHRSLSLCNQFGFKSIRTFSTLVFSRNKPVEYLSVSPCQEHEKELVISHLKEFYKQYNLFSTDNLFYKDNYYVLKDANGDIVAGVQANRVKWELKGIPGFLGKYLLHILPHLYFINQYFSKDFIFMSFEAVFYKDGFERKLDTLFESILSKNQMHTALIWVDDHSELFKQVKKINRGIFGSLLKFKPARVIVKADGLSTQEESKLSELPVYISAFDLT